MSVIDDLERDATDELKHFFGIPWEKREDNDFKSARIAQATYSACAKMKQNESASTAVNFSVARELAENKEELAKYVRLAMPGHPIIPALPTGKKRQ